MRSGFGAGRGEQTAQTRASSKLLLNLGHRDSPKQHELLQRVNKCVGDREVVKEGGPGIRSRLLINALLVALM